MNFTLLFLSASIALAMGAAVQYDRVQGGHGYMTKLSVIPTGKMFITFYNNSSIDPNMGVYIKLIFLSLY